MIKGKINIWTIDLPFVMQNVTTLIPITSRQELKLAAIGANELKIQARENKELNKNITDAFLFPFSKRILWYDSLQMGAKVRHHLPCVGRISCHGYHFLTWVNGGIFIQIYWNGSIQDISLYLSIFSQFWIATSWSPKQASTTTWLRGWATACS